MAACSTLYSGIETEPPATDAGEDAFGLLPGDPGDGGTVVGDGPSTPDGPASVDGATDAPMSDGTTFDGPNDSGLPPLPSCGGLSTALGEYATWSGKVNVHRAANGLWSVDSDCSSGANNNTVAYCQKFWPKTVTQMQYANVTTTPKPFTAGGGAPATCGGLYLDPGQAQFVCCGLP